MRTARDVADNVQEQLEAGVIAPAELIGTELELRARHGVSLTTLRRAVRILEERQVAVMRRGTNGGLYAERPSIDAAANYVAAQWERTAVAPAVIMQDAQALNGLLLRHASDRMSLADSVMIVELHAQCRLAGDPMVRSELAARREQAIARLSANPVAEFTHAVMLRYLRNLIPFEVLAQDDAGFATRTQRLVDEKIRGLISGDTIAAVQASGEYLRAYMERMDNFAVALGEHSLATAQSQSSSLPMLVSRRVLREIRERGWNAGEFLGRESELMRRFGVGRNTWRQALSILIEYSAVESRRGGGGGIFVAPVNREAALGVASNWLVRQKVSSADCREVFAEIAPHHVAEVLNNDGNLPISRPLGCGAMLELVLKRATSPLLTLSVLTLDTSAFSTASSVDLRSYRLAEFGPDLIKRAVRKYIMALPDPASLGRGPQGQPPTSLNG